MKTATFKIGEKFNNWTILSRAANNKFSQPCANAVCLCGHKAVRVVAALRKHKKHNGQHCAKCAPNSKHKTHVLLKLKPNYGDLRVIDQKLGPQYEKNVLVKCKCGSPEKWVSVSSLKHGFIQSCGCWKVLKKKQAKKRVGKSARKAPKKGSKLYMRRLMTVDDETGCNQDGLCRWYVKCGDSRFEGDCAGFLKQLERPYRGMMGQELLV